MRPARWVGIAVTVAACGGPAAGRRAENRAGGGDGCLPADIVAAPMAAPAEDGTEPPAPRTFRLVTRDGRTHVCADRYRDGNTTREACWELDLGSGGVRAAAIVEEPGAPRRLTATTTAAGLCAEGYCVPLTEPAPVTDDDGTAAAELAVGADGAAVMLAGARFTIFAPDRTPRPPVDYFAGVGDNGPSAAPGEPHLVGDVIFVGDFDAGPHADVHAWRGNGTPIGPIADPTVPGYEGEFELYDGSVAALSDHEVGFVERRLARVLVFDTRTLKTTVWTRHLAPVVGCTPEATAMYLDDVGDDLSYALERGMITQACLDALVTTHGRFRGDAGVARAPSGALVGLARDPGGAALVVLVPSGGVSRELPLAVCGQ